MVLIGGVFFPVDALPAALQAVSVLLPLSHAVEIARPLVGGTVPAGALKHVLVLLGYATAGFYVALVLSRRRLLA
jgi:lipooligosaccharide transport system permease protein